MKMYSRTRQPRQNEIELLSRLALGRLPLSFGPVGRCSNRGWIRFVEMNENCCAVFELTASGRTRLEEHRANQRLAGILGAVSDHD